MSDKRMLRVLRLVAVTAPLALTGCDWFTTFSRQPSIHTWQAVNGDTTKASRGNPKYSVPTTGVAVAEYQVSTLGMPPALDSLANLQNPNPPTDASIQNGHKYYAINCSPCHGDAGGDLKTGFGNGPVAERGRQFGLVPLSLLTDQAKGRSDGYIFAMIRNGRGSMPSYIRIEEPDRWDIVNYVRGLQGKLGHPVPTGPLAEPGVTGDKVPGATRLGPTVPAPFYNMWKHMTGTTVPQDSGKAHDSTNVKTSNAKAGEGTR